jgi:hypothetical protein
MHRIHVLAVTLPLEVACAQELKTDLEQLAATQEPADFHHDTWKVPDPSDLHHRARIHDLIDPALSPLQFRAQYGMEEQ